jgi:hypothetical protein
MSSNLLPRPIWVRVKVSKIRFQCSERCSGHNCPPLDVDQWEAIIGQELDDWDARTGAKKKKRLKSIPGKSVKIFGQWS